MAHDEYVSWSSALSGLGRLMGGPPSGVRGLMTCALVSVGAVIGPGLLSSGVIKSALRGAWSVASITR